MASIEAMDDPDLALRRLNAQRYTVDEAIGLGYRLMVVCLRCERRVPIDLHGLSKGGRGARPIKSLSPTCLDCQRRRRKYSIHPAGKDTLIKVLFPGEIDVAPERRSPF